MTETDQQRQERIERHRKIKPGARIRHSQPIEGIDTGVVFARSGAYVFICSEHPEQGRFDMEIYDTEVTEILEENVRIPMSDERFARMVALAQPETLERKCARNIAERELRWMKERGEAILTDEGKWKLVA